MSLRKVWAYDGDIASRASLAQLTLLQSESERFGDGGAQLTSDGERVTLGWWWLIVVLWVDSRRESLLKPRTQARPRLGLLRQGCRLNFGLDCLTVGMLLYGKSASPPNSPSSCQIDVCTVGGSHELQFDVLTAEGADGRGDAPSAARSFAMSASTLCAGDGLAQRDMRDIRYEEPCMLLRTC
jgi:hypothetical protein